MAFKAFNATMSSLDNKTQYRSVIDKHIACSIPVLVNFKAYWLYQGGCVFPGICLIVNRISQKLIELITGKFC